MDGWMDGDNRADPMQGEVNEDDEEGQRLWTHSEEANKPCETISNDTGEDSVIGEDLSAVFSTSTKAGCFYKGSAEVSQRRS